MSCLLLGAFYAFAASMGTTCAGLLAVGMVETVITAETDDLIAAALWANCSAKRAQNIRDEVTSRVGVLVRLLRG